MNPFIQGILAGYGIAVPVGAIAILIIETGLRRGFHLGFAAGAGAASADLAYAVLAAVAGQSLVGIINPYAEILRWGSAVVLVVIGLAGLWRSWNRQSEITVGYGIETDRHSNAWRTYIRFASITLLNPMTIAYFGAIIIGGSGDLTGWGAKVWFVVGAALASLSWQTLLAVLGAGGRKKFSPAVQRAVSIVGNLIVVVLGIRMVLSV